MKKNTLSSLSPVVAAACGATLLLAPLSTALGGTAASDECQADIAVIAGDYMACLLRAYADDLTDGSDGANGITTDVDGCNAVHLARYVAAVNRDPESCPGSEASWSGITDHVAQLMDSSFSAIDQVGLLVSGRPALPDAGKVIFFNNCDLSVKLMSPDLAAVDGNVIAAGEHESLSIDELNANSPNVVMVAPVTSKAQCGRIQCKDWTAVQPNTVQREPSMWQGDNKLYAAYCQPTNAAAVQCLADPATTPCCGPNMNYDRTFGTHLEITPNTPVGNDFVNLSTNSKPPALCDGTNPDNCVLPSANIFFNVPIRVDMSGGDCSCGTLNQRSQLQCLAVDCTDAYTYPTDPKQCACSSGNQRGYTVTYCPDQNSQLPSIPRAATETTPM